MYIKKIFTRDLRVGMYVDDLNCRWLENPFFKKSLMLSSEVEIQKIYDAQISELYIDTRKGLDVFVPAEETETEFEADENIDMEEIEFPFLPKQADENKTSTSEEWAYATTLRDKAEKQIMCMMKDARLGKVIELDLVDDIVSDVTGSILRNSSALISLLRIKTQDNYTFLHSLNTCALLVTFCHALGIDEETTRQAGIGGLLHDMGKSIIPASIINKPGKLTDSEFDMMKRHPSIGYTMLAKMPNLGEIPIDIALNHHEKIDGSGYPTGKTEISKLAQMAGIVDIYDALTSDRAYHQGRPAVDALKMLYNPEIFVFDPALISAFIRCIGIYPVGSLVRISTGNLGVIIENCGANTLRPIVKVIFNAKTNAYIEAFDIDLSKPESANLKIIDHESPEKWGINPMDFLNLTPSPERKPYGA